MRATQLIVIIIYIAIVCWIANRARQRTTGLNDYLCPKLGAWTVALTGFATAFSTSTLVVGAGFGYGFGVTALWMAAPQALGLAVMFLLFSVPINRMTTRLGSLTISEFLGERYKSDVVRGLAAIILFVFCVGHLIVIYRGVGLVITQVMNVPYWLAVLLAGFLAAIYTSYGGQIAVADTDVFQGWLMTIGVLILIPVAIIKGGGMSAIHLKLAEISPKLIETPGNYQWGVFMGLILVFSVGMLGQPQLLYRTMFIRNKKDIPKIAVISFFISLVAVCIAFYCGVTAKVLLPNLASSDLAMPTLLTTLLHPILATVLMVAMCAAAMSTTDSILIMASSAISRDLYQKVINPKATDEMVQKLSGRLSLLLGAIGTVWALKPPQAFIFLMAFVWAVWTAAYMFPILYGIYWRGVTTNGAIAGMILGPLAAVIWKQMGQPLGLHPLFPGMLASALVIPIVSSFTQKLPEEFLDMLFAKDKKEIKSKIATNTVKV